MSAEKMLAIFSRGQWDRPQAGHDNGITITMRWCINKHNSNVIPIKLHIIFINFSDTEFRIFQDYYVNIMAADAMAPCVTRPSATMVLTMKYKLVLPVIFHKEWYQLITALSQYSRMLL